ERVLDARTAAGAVAGRFDFEAAGAPTFAGTVDRGSAPRGTGGHDGQVIDISLGARTQANLVGDGRKRRLGETRAIRKQDEREGLRLRAKGIQEAAYFRVAFGELHVNPLIRHLIAGKEIAQLVRAIGPA